MSKKKNFSSNAGSNRGTTSNRRIIDVYTDTDLFDEFKLPRDPEEDCIRAYLAGLDEWRDEQAAYAEEAMQQDAFEEQFNDPVVVYFYEEVLDELRSLEEAKNHMIEEFNHREEMYKDRASGIEFDYWCMTTFGIQ